FAARGRDRAHSLRPGEQGSAGPDTRSSGSPRSKGADCRDHASALELGGSERRTAPLERVKDRPAAAVWGIGNPEAFRRTLHDLGATVAEFRTFPDHHAYTRADVESLRDWARQQATDGMVLTTQKDLVKLPLAQLGGRELWAVRIGLHFTSGQAELDRKLEEAVGSGP